MTESQALSFSEKSVIFREGDTTNEMYIILTGDVRITKATGDGKSLVLAELGPGAMIGEMSLISGQPRSATATAITDTTLKVITKAIFTKTASGIPAWAMCIARVLIERLRQTNITLKKHAHIEVLQKVEDEEIEFSSQFAIEYNESKNPYIIYLKGYFFSHDIPELERFIFSLIRKKITKISLDFSQVMDIDGPAIEFLITIADRLKKSNINFSVFNVQLIHTKFSTNNVLKHVISTIVPPRKIVSPDTYLIHQNEVSDIMYIIKSGRFQVVRNVNGRNVSFAEIGAGDIIGEMTLIAGGKRSASVKAVKPSVVYVITQEDINNNKFNIPHWFLRIIQQLISRIRDSDEILDRLVKKEKTDFADMGIEFTDVLGKSKAGVFKLKGNLIPQNRLSFKNQLVRLINNGFYHIILDFSHITDMDISYIPLLQKIAAYLSSKNGKLIYSGINTKITAMIQKEGGGNQGGITLEHTDATPPPLQSESTSSPGSKESRDELTGLYTPDYLHNALEQEIERCSRYKSVISVLSICIDCLQNIKTPNESNEYIQKEIASLIKKRFRKVDIPARIPDMVFQIVLPGTDIGNAKKVAEHFCKVVKEKKFWYNNKKINLSYYCGIASYGNQDNAESLLKRSRKAIQKAKEKGNEGVAIL
jgi:diguanylate cyclase (GGDEF)-like protein